jgi:hypothetical protein
MSFSRETGAAESGDFFYHESASFNALVFGGKDSR